MKRNKNMGPFDPKQRFRRPTETVDQAIEDARRILPKGAHFDVFMDEWSGVYLLDYKPERQGDKVWNSFRHAEDKAWRNENGSFHLVRATA